MGRDAGEYDAYVRCPDGRILTLADLPPPQTRRWVPRRKADVVTAVQGGLLTLDEACERYAMSSEEYLAWKRAIEHHGLAGLRRAYIRPERSAAATRPARALDIHA